jgi:uncharacterized protein (TIGR02328 family)
MRLWHEDLLPQLPKQWLQGQHRECCAMRGKGWGKKHSVVDYVWTHPYMCLFRYHTIVMSILINAHNVDVDRRWFEPKFRGNMLGIYSLPNEGEPYRYQEHNEKYLKECLKNLEGKGINLNGF